MIGSLGLSYMLMVVRGVVLAMVCGVGGAFSEHWRELCHADMAGEYLQHWLQGLAGGILLWSPGLAALLQAPCRCRVKRGWPGRVKWGGTDSVGGVQWGLILSSSANYMHFPSVLFGWQYAIYIPSPVAFFSFLYAAVSWLRARIRQSVPCSS